MAESTADTFKTELIADRPALPLAANRCRMRLLGSSHERLNHERLRKCPEHRGRLDD
jgi:hypothetical protein